MNTIQKKYEQELTFEQKMKNTPAGQLLVAAGFDPWNTESSARRVAEYSATELARLTARCETLQTQLAREIELTAARAQCAELEQENALLIAGHTPPEVPVVTTAGAVPEPDELTVLRAECAHYREALDALTSCPNWINRGPEWKDISEAYAKIAVLATPAIPPNAVLVPKAELEGDDPPRCDDDTD